MSTSQIYLIRHGATAWSRSGHHTGRTDVPLLAEGERDAIGLVSRLSGLEFSLVLSSPLQRAHRTAELAGFGSVVQVEEDLAEWCYGNYEGKTADEIRVHHPGWELFDDGCPDGESLADVVTRAERVIARVRKTQGNVALFAHGHLLRVLASRWIDAPGDLARRLALGTTAVSILGFGHSRRDEPVIVRWNTVGPLSN